MNLPTLARTLLEKAKAATEGPWQVLEDGCIHRTGEWEHQGNVPPQAIVCSVLGWENERPYTRVQIEKEDAAHIAACSPDALIPILTEYLSLLEENAKMKEMVGHLLNKVNAVTSPHRHGNSVSLNRIDELANYQIEVEKHLAKHFPKVPAEGNGEKQMNLGGLEFTAEDFDGLRNEFWFPQLLEQANRILSEKLAGARAVFLKEAGGVAGNFIEADGYRDHTHTARLVLIEEKDGEDA